MHVISFFFLEMPFVSDDLLAPIPGDTAEHGATEGKGNRAAHEHGQNYSRPSLKLTLKRKRDDFWTISSTNKQSTSFNSPSWNIPSPNQATTGSISPSWNIPSPNQATTGSISPSQATTGSISPSWNIPSTTEPVSCSNIPLLRKKGRFPIGQLAKQRKKERDLTHYDTEISKKANILQAYGNRVTQMKQDEQDLTHEVIMTGFFCYKLFMLLFCV